VAAPATLSSSRTILGIRWRTIALITLGSALNFLTRSSLAVAAPTLLAELHISERQYSWITGAFQGGIMLQPVVGYIIDLTGLKLGLAVFAIAWSVISMAHGLAGNWRALAWLRGALGFAEGTANPAGMKVVSEWFPARERGLAGGLYNIGASVGSMLAPPLVAFAILAWNWRAAFVATGALGLVWAGLWLLFYQAPARHPRLSDRERDYIAGGQEAHLQKGDRPRVLRLLQQRNFWGIALPRFLADPTWGTLTFWAPLYLATARHFDLKQIALFAWTPFLAADLGCLFGPGVAALLQRFGVGLINARRSAFTVGALLMTGIAFVGYVRSPYAAVALLSLAGFAHQTLSVTVITMASDLFKTSEVATVAGMAGSLGNAGLLISTLVLGALVAEIGYAPFFPGLAALDLIGAAVLWALVRDPARAGAA
jgi:ACS family hexuronate transporter-like MFS transporter